MSGFSAQWLALREPYDLRARNRAVLDAVTAHFADRPAVSVVDLACGTGSSLRAISPYLPVRQSWRLVDNDLGLLARTPELAEPPHRIVQVRAIDLGRDLELALDGALDLVTCSALLDLVSADFVERLVVEVAARRLPVYAALSYDGGSVLDPPAAFDAEMLAAVNRHQRRDKGFGPALGPQAAAQAIARFEAVGYAVVQGHSEWVFGTQDDVIQREILSGWASAARELGDVPLERIAAWLTRRLELIADARAQLRIGHIDFFASAIGRR
ncbi:MAG TPA: class I SAM-dependent methyltransferase [Xanthobacteraceae bacterium]|nr:class I SAM-dependent methyltransferase [Xanthobacteraceae bacterium]